MTQAELQNGTTEHEHFEITPMLDAMIRSLPAADRQIFMGRLWSLERVYSGLILYRKVSMLVRSTFGKERSEICKQLPLFTRGS